MGFIAAILELHLLASAVPDFFTASNSVDRTVLFVASALVTSLL